MGGEQAATVLATITKDQRAREGKEVMTNINLPICVSLLKYKLLPKGKKKNQRHFSFCIDLTRQNKIRSVLNVAAMTYPEWLSHQTSVIKRARFVLKTH